MTNNEMLNRGFRYTLLTLAPFVVCELKAYYGSDWWELGVLDSFTYDQKKDLPTTGSDDELENSLDILRCLQLINWQWKDIFNKKLAKEQRSWINELIDVRHAWAHAGREDFDNEYTWRALDTMTRLLEPIDTTNIEEIRKLARTVLYGSPEGSAQSVVQPEEVQKAIPKNAGIMREAPIKGLKPWREVIQPHPDVAQGRYQKAEFAADLSQVARGEGSPEYRDPVEFFSRTYVTEGMKGLLAEAIKRVSGKDGEPVIQLKTAFGGGKTHSMLALYHLLRGTVPVDKLPNAKAVLEAAQVTTLPKVHVAVVVGTALDPTKARRPPTMPGITINTLWGEIAAQLTESSGKKDLYNFIKKADNKGVSPGSNALRGMFDAVGPCMILIDELVAYAKKLYGVDGLIAGSFDNLITFIQELTEAVRSSKNSVLIASLPESELEIGGEAGQRVLETIEHTLGRMESIWKPVAAHEGFEVVRRRLFSPCSNEGERDAVCNAFSNMYIQNASDFPIETKELEYRNRLISCYPIHPEVFDRLYEDWATLERFQRTRGVLRLMAAVIYDLWIRGDQSLMIMPSSFPLDVQQVRDELSRHLSDSWNAIIERDVDGTKSVPFLKDKEIERFGKHIAARRVARTIFLGSAPSVKQMNLRGIETTRIRLGVIQPGEHIAVFNDALTTLRDSLTYLYSNTNATRFYYDTRPTLQKTAADRATLLNTQDVLDEVENRIRSSQRAESFKGIHIWPSSSLDVPDEKSVRLVVLHPTKIHNQGNEESSALVEAQKILETRGESPRMFKNMLVFAAADSSIKMNLFEEVKMFLAWKSIEEDTEEINLDQTQIKEVQRNLKRHDDTISLRIHEAYSWLFVPGIDVEHDKKTVQWDCLRIGGARESIATRAYRRMVQDEEIIAKWAPPLLMMELNKWFLKEKSFIRVKDLWDMFATHLYLPRLLNFNVLADAIAQGVEGDEYFGLADGISEEGTYYGLKIKKKVESVEDSHYIIRYAEAIAAVKDKTESQIVSTDTEEDFVLSPDESFPADTPASSQSSGPKSFHLSTKLDTPRYIREIGKINEEILNHLLSIDGANVEIRLHVEVDFDKEVSLDTIRTVTENCRTLKIDDSGFN